MIYSRQHIEVNPKIMMGKPVVKGTRVTVEQVLENLSESNSIDDVRCPLRPLNSPRL